MTAVPAHACAGAASGSGVHGHWRGRRHASHEQPAVTVGANPEHDARCLYMLLAAMWAAATVQPLAESHAHRDMHLPVCRWVPKQERSRSLALVYSGMYTGSILGLALSPHMVSRFTLLQPALGIETCDCCP